MLLARVDAGGVTEALARVAAPWAKVFADYKAVSAGVLFLHLVPLVVAAGAAFAADRATLRAASAGPGERSRQLKELAAIHRVVRFGLALSLVSGVLMFLSDVETFLGSVFFWIKLVCVGLLLVNGYFMTRTEQALAAAGENEALWARMRTIALVSATLWLVTTLAGVVLKEYA